jgi:hypothetical protein
MYEVEIPENEELFIINKDKLTKETKEKLMNMPKEDISKIEKEV